MKRALAIQHNLTLFFIIGLVLVLAGCTSLLPHSTQEVTTPWKSYSEAQATFDKIIPQNTTLSALKQLGFDPAQTTNISILNHADLIRRLIGTGSFDIDLIDDALHACLSSKSTCFAYELEQTFTDKKRIGNFWLDFLNFDKQTDINGWQFDAIVVLSNDLVIYKQWSGKPSTHQFERERNPLGPLQGWGPSLIQPH
ncbi:MAG TPA: hypothetical protein VIF82_04135 [Burkholderiaceae bacterium]|jgi:hypothetical protein